MMTSVPNSGDPYRVKLDSYNGPLDFLLFLIKRNEVDIRDIPIATVLEQYLAHIEVMNALNMDDVGDFLVVASTLMVIKSRMLLPTECKKDEVGEEEEIDPRSDLVHQLLEYKRFRDAADLIDDARRDRQRVLPRGAFAEVLLEEEYAENELTGGRLLEDVGLWSLFEVFSRLMSEVTLVSTEEIVFDEVTLEESVAYVQETLRRDRRTTLKGLLRGKRDRGSVIGVFLALLELAKGHAIRLQQIHDFGDIEIIAEEEPVATEPHPSTEDGVSDDAPPEHGGG